MSSAAVRSEIEEMLPQLTEQELGAVQGVVEELLARGQDERDVALDFRKP